MKKQFYVKFFACVYGSLGIFQVAAARLYQDYQDIVVDNVVVETGLSDCQRCYDTLKPILDRYKRPITVLDLGAGQGYFSFRIAQDYDATCVMVEDNNDSCRRADQLLELCHLNARLRNIALLNKKMSLQELQKLADCEHFDVVLAFDYIDHKDSAWKQTVDAILRLGDNIFIQAPWSSVPSEDTEQRAVIENLVARSGTLMLQTPCAYEPKIEEQLFWFQCHKEGLRCKCFVWGSDDAYMNLFRIKSTYTSKVFLKNGSSSGPEWKRGINLVTFLALNGTYPTKSDIKQTISKLTRERLSDFTPWNLIVQGSNLSLIDQSDKGYRVDIQKSLNFIHEVIDQPSVQGILHMFKKFSHWHTRSHKKNWFLRLF